MHSEESSDGVHWRLTFVFKMKGWVICFLVAAVSAVNGASLPKIFNKCTREDFFSPEGRCILAEANRVKEIIAKGLPELGLEPIDPLKVDRLVLKSGPLTLTQNNVLFKGLSKCEIKELSIDEKKHTGVIHIYGNFTLKSDYDMAGRLILLELTSKGKSVIKMENTDMIMKFKWELVKGADGEEYFNAITHKQQLKYGNVRIKMDNLLGNDKLLSDTINQLLNENWRDLMKDFGPTASEGITAKVDSILNSLYGKIPFNTEMFKQ